MKTLTLKEKTPTTRPYWHVDLKWVFGISFAFFFGLLLLSILLMNVTNKKNGIKIMTIGLAVAYSGGDLDKTEDFEEAKKQAGTDGNFCPIPNSNICININEYEKLGPREARLRFWGQFAEMIYAADFATYATNQEQVDQIKADSTFLRIGASAKSNNIIKIIFFIFLALSAMSLVFLIRFSYRWGKLVSPGIIMLLISLPGFLIMGFLSILKSPSPDPGNPGPFGRYAPIAKEVAPIISKIGLKIYLSALLGGIILLIVAFIGKKVTAIKDNK